MYLCVYLCVCICVCICVRMRMRRPMRMRMRVRMRRGDWGPLGHFSYFVKYSDFEKQDACVTYHPYY